jgi:hypothetical protein
MRDQFSLEINEDAMVPLAYDCRKLNRMQGAWPRIPVALLGLVVSRLNWVQGRQLSGVTRGKRGA